MSFDAHFTELTFQSQTENNSFLLMILHRCRAWLVNAKQDFIFSLFQIIKLSFLVFDTISTSSQQGTQVIDTSKDLKSLCGDKDQKGSFNSKINAALLFANNDHKRVLITPSRISVAYLRYIQ